MEDKYVVIKESDLLLLKEQADNTDADWKTKLMILGITLDSIPAQQLWDAAQFNRYLPNNMNDFLTEQFDK